MRTLSGYAMILAKRAIREQVRTYGSVGNAVSLLRFCREVRYSDEVLAGKFDVEEWRYYRVKVELGPEPKEPVDLVRWRDDPTQPC